MRVPSYFLFSVILIATTRLFAHGEDRLGPHGGYIRMPGAFHTEVVPVKTGFRLYLLDINWKNPTTIKSSVEVFLSVDQNQSKMACRREKSSFFCPSRENSMGELIIEAIRDGQKGIRVSYTLPLKLKDSADPNSPPTEKHHKGH